MKILIMIGSFKTGGAERMSINTGEELTRKGYDVYYLLQKPVFEIPNTIPLERIIVLRPEARSDLFYKVTRLFIGVFLKTRAIRPDVIIAFSRFSSFLACFTFHPKIFARFDMNPFELSKKQHVWADVVLRYFGVRKVVVPSTGMYKALQKARPTYRHKIEVIPNSIDQTAVHRKASEGKTPYSFRYLVGMGRLSQQKNFEMLIRAFAKSKIRYQLKLVVIGDGTLRTTLTALIHSLALKDDVILTGQLSNPFPVVAGATFMVNASSRESFCNVILEGLTLSLPVVATDCNYGPSDLVENGYNGFLIKNNDIEDLVNSLDRIADDPSMLERWRANAIASSKQFELSNVIEKWIALIR
jgi:GalNAc-alpha-(1->4)-GalNAc-alpha-(1->3)-diNAcBac-PP-undecaprenol alpha-1,4-N-acetyl-D-galactosaminyltransferase